MRKSSGRLELRREIERLRAQRSIKAPKWWAIQSAEQTARSSQSSETAQGKQQHLSLHYDSFKGEMAASSSIEPLRLGITKPV